MVGPDPFEELDAVSPRELCFAHDAIDVHLLEPFERRVGSRRGFDFHVTQRSLERTRQLLPLRVVRVDVQDGNLVAPGVVGIPHIRSERFGISPIQHKRSAIVCDSILPRTTIH